MIVLLLGFYQRWISPVLHSVAGAGGACRFQPTCSEYAAVAVERHRAFRGLALAVWRLLRCNPLSRGGFDPVPGTLNQGPRQAQLAGVEEGESGSTAKPCKRKYPGRDFGTEQRRHLP